MFYNTENTFDTIDNPHTTDNDFLPTGSKKWNFGRYYHKLQNISKVIIAVGEKSAPDIVALAEIENKNVLLDLLKLTPLNKVKYTIIHYESPDRRGIDVAILFRSDKLKLLSSKPFRIDFPNSQSLTRDILMAKFSVANDTFVVFVNHWPSRIGGEQKTENLRCFVADRLHNITDSIFKKTPRAKIIITGDLNDEPIDISLTKHLLTNTTFTNISHSKLYNLTAQQFETGSMKYRGKWYAFDQMIVSGSLLNSQKGISTSTKNVRYFTGDFILETDDKLLGMKLIPTFSGPKYIGGYSDHLPVIIDIHTKK